MYLPNSFKEDSLDVLHRFMRSNPLGLLISSGSAGPIATSIPFYLYDDGSEFGTLQAHLARANPQCECLADQNVLVVFQGADAYISPNWYPSKDEHQMVVPTWNYVMVQARGIANVIDDETWLKRQITLLTNHQEQARPEPWKVSAAPETYIDSQIKAIIGIEIKIAQLEGKWKLSQNRSMPDRKGVADNLRAEGNTEMSELVRQYGNVDNPQK